MPAPPPPLQRARAAPRREEGEDGAGGEVVLVLEMSEYGSPSRYRDAKPRVDSGYNTRKEDIRWGGRLNSRFRREENFRRVSCKTLVKLLDEDSGVDVLLLDLRDADDFEKNHIANGASSSAERAGPPAHGARRAPAPRASPISALVPARSLSHPRPR